MKTTEKTFRPDIRPGATVRVHQKITEMNTKGENKERIQVFEGVVFARKHGSEIGAGITVRRISEGVGVEKVYPLFSPLITKIEVLKQGVVRRAKLAYLRDPNKKLKDSRKK
ncbi:MAG: 50S ribosomal protein L19 [Candidatus Magasanikbacteria bacterium]|nr:50S ribosomal protein L19 [Candidatus Magasanikbacteria bacterium]